LLEGYRVGQSIDTLEVLTGDFVGPYLLLGTPTGLYFVDTTQPFANQIPIKLIPDTRFKQIAVLEDYGVLLALSGRHDWVRQYRLRSLKKLILYWVGQVYGKAAVPMLGVTVGINTQQSAELKAAAAQAVAKADGQPAPATRVPTKESIRSTGTEDEDVYAKAAARTAALDPNANLGEREQVARWAQDFIKLTRTKHSKRFLVERTQGSAHLITHLGQDLLLMTWASEPYYRFMEVDAFWLPENPKFIGCLQDGFYIRDIWLGYKEEANLIDTSDAQVYDLAVPTSFPVPAGTKPRWTSWVQIPFDESVRNQLATFGRPNSTINKKLRAALAPTQAGRGAEVPMLFLGTVGNTSQVIDIEGQKVDTGTFGYGTAANRGWTATWNFAPTEVLIARGKFVAAIGENQIQLASWKTGEIVQTLKSPNNEPIRVLCFRNDKLYVLAGRPKSKRGFTIYMLSEIAARAVGQVPGVYEPLPKGGLVVNVPAAPSAPRPQVL